MGSNSFLVFNPGKANQETDGEYLANATRLNGAVTGLFPSLLANKIFYQASVMAAAWGEVFKGLGFTVADTDFNALVTILTTILTKAGGNLTGAINETYTTLVAASTVNIGAANANFIIITGTTTITQFDTIQEGTRRILYFTGAVTLTHNSTKLILPGGVNITTQAKACAEFVSLGSGNWVCTNYSADILVLDGDTLTLSGAGLKVTDDIFAFLAGEEAQPFSAADGSTGKEVVNISQFTSVIANPGYIKLPGGFIAQFAKIAKPGGGWTSHGKDYDYTATFLLPFPNACILVVPSVYVTMVNNNYPTDFIPQIGGTPSKTQVTLVMCYSGAGGSNPPDSIGYIAIGY